MVVDNELLSGGRATLKLAWDVAVGGVCSLLLSAHDTLAVRLINSEVVVLIALA